MKTVVITGASRGIGLATANKFLENGWHVIGTFNRTVVSVVHPELVSIHLDITSEESIAKAVEHIQRVAPQIDALVNNAGVSSDAFENAPHMQTVRATFETNVFGLMTLTEKLLPLLVSNSRVVNVSSRYGAFSFPIDGLDSTAYRMSKAALNMYTRTLAFRLKKRGIIVSAIHPGWVKTAMGNSAATEKEKPTIEPEDAANDIYNLVTNDSASGEFWQFGKQREW